MTGSALHIAELNIARALAPVDSPLLDDFNAALDPINALADRAPGFVWRLQTDEGNATAIRPFDDDRMIVNMSVWESIDALAEFVYRSEHVAVMRRRREWFERIQIFMVLWWVPSRPHPLRGRGDRAPRAPPRARADPARVHLQGPVPRR